MAITNGYATRAELKEALDPDGNLTWSGGDDTRLDSIVEAASRFIDAETGTHFYSDTQTRYYTARWSDWLPVDDLLSVTTLKTDDDNDATYETTWTSTDYVLEPKNAAANSNDVRPYRAIRRDERQGDYSFPKDVEDGVEIVGSWGYASTTPPAIHEACLLISMRLWKRKDAIFGVAGNVQTGVTVIQAKIRRDADVMMLLNSIDRNDPIMV